ncbi:MAG TPA: pilus assembly protein TadG-related protein [Beijerinckiaceae bacterium]|jgi:hypothetical protein
MRTFRQFGRDRDGNVAVVFALMLLPVVAMAGFALDYTRATQARSSLQMAADTAAIAAVSAYVPSNQQREAIARSTFRGMAQDAPPNVTVNATAQRAVVVANARVKPAVIGIVQPEEIAIGARAVAVKVYDGPPPCILALSPVVAGAIRLTEGAALTGQGCVLHANSSNSTAIAVESHVSLKAAGTCAVGTITSSQLIEPRPQAYCDVMDDPFRALPAPTSTACQFGRGAGHVGPGETRVLDPGVYCDGLDLKGNVTLKPGLYVVRDGPLAIGPQAKVSGQGVTFYLTGSKAGLNVKGDAVSLSAATEGTYRGLLFVQDRNAAAGGKSILSGGEATKLLGAIYLPTQSLTLEGAPSKGRDGAVLSSRFLPIIAEQVKIAGAVSVAADPSVMTLPRPLPRSQSGARLEQ